MMTTFDRAWNIAKEERDYSKFGEKFAEMMERRREEGRGLPEGTKFSDLRSTSSGAYNAPRYSPRSVIPDMADIFSGAGAEKDTRPPMPKGVPINILDLPNYRPDPDEEENQEVVRRVMGTKDYDSAVDLITQLERDKMEAESAKRHGHRDAEQALERINQDMATARNIDMATGGSSAPNPFIPDTIKYPKSLIDRVRRAGPTPKDD